jgi:hypothetical protein
LIVSGLVAPEAERSTDKTLENFFFVGLIHLALPNAHIIHIRHNPVDTSLSCFSTLFGRNNRPYSYDLAEIGYYYRAYEVMMAHWRDVLPSDVMLELNYEEVVADIEGESTSQGQC